jgi:hypothetical protein
VDQIIRLGGTVVEPDISTVKWPTGEFNSPKTRIRSEFPELAHMDEYEIDDHIHPLRCLTFLSNPTLGFWDGWTEAFSGTDPSRFAPFSSDEAYFYFVDTDTDSDNPDIYYVDHETTDETPYHFPSFDLQTFLRILERS